MLFRSVKEVVNIKKLVKLTDKDNKVTVSSYDLKEDWTLKADVKDKNSVEKLKDLDTDLYDIYFVDKDGNKVNVYQKSTLRKKWPKRRKI